jgi:hypothetical protein
VTTPSDGTQVSTNPAMAEMIVKTLNPGSSGRP